MTRASWTTDDHHAAGVADDVACTWRGTSYIAGWTTVAELRRLAATVDGRPHAGAAARRVTPAPPGAVRLDVVVRPGGNILAGDDPERTPVEVPSVHPTSWGVVLEVCGVTMFDDDVGRQADAAAAAVDAAEAGPTSRRPLFGVLSTRRLA